MLFVSIATILLALAPAPAFPTLQSAPPRHCQLRNGSWCILGEGYVITAIIDENAREKTFVASNSVLAHRFVVIQRGECSASPSTVVVRRYGEGFAWDRSVWAFADIALNQTCSIEVLSPPSSQAIAELRSALAQIRVCDTEACDADRVMSKLIVQVRD